MEFKLPELGEGVHEGELVSWKIKVGDMVKEDQSLCEVMTDKATVEIPSPFAGKVSELKAKEGQTVHVGQTLITFEGKVAAGKAAPSSAHAQASNPAPAVAPSHTMASPSHTSQQPVVAAAQSSPESRVLASPATRRLARESGIDLGRVSGTGPAGRVLKQDLDQFLGATAAGSPQFARAQVARSSVPFVMPAGGEERVVFKGLRKKIAEKMRQSKDKAAHFTYVEEADATELVKLRAQAKELGAAQGVKVTYLPFILKAMVAALKRYPTLNSTLDEQKGEWVIKHYYNIGLSIQTDDGLTAPVIKNVESKTVFQLAKEIQDLVDRARAKKLTMDDLQGGTITLTNAGSIGGLFATPVINFPEVAILGFNKIFRKPVVKMIGGREKVVVRDWTYFSISLDHRLIDGAVGAEFMKTFIQYVESPTLLILENL